MQGKGLGRRHSGQVRFQLCLLQFVEIILKSTKKCSHPPVRGTKKWIFTNFLETMSVLVTFITDFQYIFVSNFK